MEAQQVILALINVSNRYMADGQFDETLRIAAQAIDIAHATNWPTQAGAALIIVALAHRARGDLDEALLSIRESERLLQPPQGETSTGKLGAYGLALIREGQILGEDQAISLNRPQDAIACLQRALKLGEDFARRDPGDFQSQYRVFSAETKLAGIVRHTDPARAVEMYDDGLRRLAGAKANAGTLRNETGALAASVYPLLRLGRRAEARKRLDAAFDRLSRLKQYPAEQVELGSPADDTLRALAEYEANGGNFRRGAELYGDLLRMVLAGDPKPETLLQDAVELSDLYQAAAPVYRRARLMDTAASLDTRRQELWSHWDTRLPHNEFVRRQMQSARQR